MHITHRAGVSRARQVAALLAILVVSLPAAGRPAAADAGTLAVSLRGSEAAVVQCTGGQVHVNGAALANGPVSCAAVIAVIITGGSGPNTIDLSGVTHASFPNVQRVVVNGGAGDDTITASDYADAITGGLGRDVLRGASLSDAFDARSGEDFTVQSDAPSGGALSQRPARSMAPGGEAWAQPAAPATAGLATIIDGITFDQDASTSGCCHIPPDPSGAAGPGHVVSVVNTSIQWHRKSDGAQQHSQALAGFFSPLAPLTSTYDPKVIYDQYAGRFVVVALEQTTSPSNTSRILIAVSDDSDPNGAWYFAQINARMTINGSDSWADYPGLAVDSQAVYITANMFRFGGPSLAGQRLWIVNKAGWYTGGALSANVYDPATATGGTATTMQPAHMYGPAPGAVGTFLVAYSGMSSVGNERLQIIRVDSALASPTFSRQSVSVGDIDNTLSGFANAPQPGATTRIHTGDRRALSAVWRDNILWASATVRPGSGPDAGEETAHWFKVNTTALNALTLADQGNAGGDDVDSGAYTYYPAISVNRYGDMGLGLALSGPSTYAGAYFTYRLTSDPAGAVQPTSVLAAGQDYYVRTFNDSRNRWGDYSGISVDPGDGSSFWVFNEFAMPRGTPLIQYPDQDGRWATRWGKFELRPVAAITSGPPNPSPVGQAVTVTVTVASALGTPTGSVTVTTTGPACTAALASGSASCPLTFAAAGVYSLTATYGGDANYASAVSPAVVHRVEAPVVGLAAANSSPTTLGQPTAFTATVSGGTSVLYSWVFGDGGTDSGATATHSYAADGVYTATVTATNGVSSQAMSTPVTVTAVTPAAGYWLYFPSVPVESGGTSVPAAARTGRLAPAAHLRHQ